jgi:hypothetical protein
MRPLSFASAKAGDRFLKAFGSRYSRSEKITLTMVSLSERIPYASGMDALGLEGIARPSEGQAGGRS